MIGGRPRIDERSDDRASRSRREKARPAPPVDLSTLYRLVIDESSGAAIYGRTREEAEAEAEAARVVDAAERRGTRSIIGPGGSESDMSRVRRSQARGAAAVRTKRATPAKDKSGTFARAEQHETRTP